MAISPLAKRLPRELFHNLGKCLGLFLLLTLAIAATSGFLSAGDSIAKLMAGSRDAYNVQDAYVNTEFEMGRGAKERLAQMGVTARDSFYADVSMTVPNGPDASSTVSGDTSDVQVRLMANRTDFDEAVYVEGRAPEADDEIALSRVFCANHGLSLGDTVAVEGGGLRIVGIVELADYQVSFQQNTGLIFNALTFAMSQVTPSTYERLANGHDVYHYALFFDDRDMGLIDRTSLESDVAEALDDEGVLVTDMADYENNQAISYAADDVDGDTMMWFVLLVLLVIIMAFVFVVLTNATIDEETSVIGTLLASGYRKGELVRHYLALPTLVGIAAAVVGNVLGYTFLVQPMQEMYYNSYDLPPYVQSFSLAVFFETTVVPVALLLVITLVGLVVKLHATPLQFLRHEAGRRRAHGALHLPARWRFVARFRTRVVLRNISHLVVLFLGIMFGSLLLMFGVCMMPVVEDYADSTASDVVAQHLYVLKAPLEIGVTDSEREAWQAAEDLATTDDLVASYDPEELLSRLVLSAGIEMGENVHPANTLENSQESIDQAEKFATTTLDLPRRIGTANEQVTIYGIQEESRYWDDIDVSGGRIVLGRGVAEKCGVDAGETFTLTSRFTGDTYEITPESLAGNETTMCIYMSLDTYNRLLDEDEGYFNGYASDESLDIDARYLAAEITPETMTQIGDQMTDSMGEMAHMLVYVALPIYLILMYLLTKTVIDRSARSISIMKVLGYRNREVSRLYVRPITFAVLVSLVASLPLVVAGLGGLMTVMMSAYSGNLPIHIAPERYVEIVAIGAATYAMVALLHLRRIRKVPAVLAMKVQE